MVLKKEHLVNIYGGKITTAKATSFTVVLGIVVTFIIGVIDGFKRPLACN